MDRAAIDEFGIAGYSLMERAASAALTKLRTRWPDKRSLRIYCGLGNNAGDGYVVARLAHAYGLDVEVVACAPVEQLRGDAATAARDCLSSGVAAQPFSPAARPAHDTVIVDALFGTGLSRPPEGDFAAAVQQINESNAVVLALDVPSGIDANSGIAAGAAIHAHCTVGFVGLKTGYFLGVGPDHCGALEFSDLKIPAEIQRRHTPALERLSLADIRRVLPPRGRTIHKGNNGRLLIIGGGPGMPGAVRMAGAAALRTGAGLVYVATHPEHAGYATAAVPELIVHGVESPVTLEQTLPAIDAIAIGPGLGQSPWAAALCEWAFAQTCPLVADADALNWLSRTNMPGEAHGERIVTPHAGEAARLLGGSAVSVQHDRLAAVRELAKRCQATAVLKGAGTLVCSADSPVSVCAAGNPGMATAGTGDVLTGITGGVLVQCGDAHAAARAAVLVHALAGDTAAAAQGERGMLATDLLSEIRQWANLS